MNVDEDVFFRQTTLRICSSLNIVTALKRSFDYISLFIPMNRMTLCILDADLNVLRFVASIGDGITEDSEQVVSLPEQGRNERATLLKNGEMVRIINQPDKKLGTKEIQERLGFNPNVSILAMVLRLEGNLIGNLGLVADGLDRYNDEHARLLRLLHEPFAIAMSNALKHKEIIRFKDMLADDNRYLHGQLRELSGDQIIGSQCGLKGVMEKVNQVATLDSPVLLLGETGVGKEVIADAIHYSSHRKDGPFIKVNCGAIPETLFDSELFGHEKGAFTGAISQKRGRFERADKGTIFLDEIGELPLQAQVRLLHVLQDRKVERVGGTNPVPLDIRIISATNRNLEEMIALGRFREDLWFRFNVFPIMIPPLRQRKQDIPELVHHFIERKSMEFKLRERPIIPAGVIDRLMAYDWPGNVRELGNMIERAMIQHRGGNLSFETLLAPPAPKSRGADPDAGRNRPLLSLEEVNIRHIRQALERAGGKINGPGGAAQILGIHPNTLRKRMNSLGIAYGRKTWQHFIQSVQSSRTSE